MKLPPVPLITSILAAMTVSAFDFSWAPSYDHSKPPTPAPGQPTWTQYFSDANPSAAYTDVTMCVASPTGGSVWGASFDDGPSPSTPGVLDFFRALPGGNRATFWLIGANVVALPQTALSTFQDGHVVGLHTWSHPNLTSLTDDQVVAELVYSARTVYEVTGKLPKYFRPPYMAIDARVRALAATMGLQAVVWNHDTNDWARHGTMNQTALIANVTKQFQTWIAHGDTNGISLEHDLYPDTAAAIPSAMNTLIAAQMKIVTLSECVGDPNPYDNPTLTTFFQSGYFENPSAYGASPNTTDGSIMNPDGTVTPAPKKKSSKKLSTGAIVGIAVGASAGALLLVGGIVGCLCWRRRKAARDAAEAKNELESNGVGLPPVSSGEYSFATAQ